jgi:hypothetical protein
LSRPREKVCLGLKVGDTMVDDCPREGELGRTGERGSEFIRDSEGMGNICEEIASEGRCVDSFFETGNLYSFGQAGNLTRLWI